MRDEAARVRKLVAGSHAGDEIAGRDVQAGLYRLRATPLRCVSSGFGNEPAQAASHARGHDVERRLDHSDRLVADRGG